MAPLHIFFMFYYACRAGAFALGLATTLALLGVLSSAVGNAYGQIGNALPLGEILQADCYISTTVASLVVQSMDIGEQHTLRLHSQRWPSTLQRTKLHIAD